VLQCTKCSERVLTGAAVDRVDEERTRAILHARLRRPPCPSSVPRSLPVLFFGDLFAARIATIGLNPSDREYLDRDQRLLDGADRRFETLASLVAIKREALTAEHCRRAIETMRGYFRPGRPVYSWFRSLDRVTRGIGFRYGAGEVAHLDLVQEATQPTWSELQKERPEEARALREADLPFLLWQLQAFPLNAVVCNGRTALEEIGRLVKARPMERGEFRRITWSVGLAFVLDRPLGVVGWNLPLARAGLHAEEEEALGALLRARIEGLGTTGAQKP